MERVVVLDFGSQYAHLIARRTRENHVYSEILPYYATLDVVKKLKPKALILSGGPSSVYDPDAPKLDPEIIKWCIENDVPVLGICYGHQLLAKIFGGEVSKGAIGEYGTAELEVLVSDPIFSSTPRKQRVWMSHRDIVTKPPRNSTILAKTRGSPIAAFKLNFLPVYGLQFHPEVKHTEHGLKIIDNFLKKIAGCKGDWRLENYLKTVIEDVKRRIGSSKVLVAASGGVDSTVTAKILLEAVGSDKVHLLVIDTGFMREGEIKEVVKSYKKMGFKYVHVIDASKRFLKALKGVKDPEEKRRLFSKTYFKVILEYARKLEEKYGKIGYIGQGTIYPDRVETGATGKATAKIKSHHNVVLADMLGAKLIEPIKDLYKDEVRKIGKMLGIPENIVKRHPFPGPGLLIRIIGEVNEEKLELLRKADKIVEEEFKKSGYYDRVWQAFPVLLSDKAVGVKGDERSYGLIIVLRVVESEDGMTANFSKLPWKLLEKISTRIVGEVEGITRVLYDITNKPPATIEFE